jgi:multidrug efflux system outer membrane protein
MAASACLSLPPNDAAPKQVNIAAEDFARAGHAAWPAQDWWKQFHDPQLDALIDQALRNSPDIDVAMARARQASATVGVVAANSGAQLSLDGQASRQLYSGNSFYPPPLAGSYANGGNLDLNFKYDFDFWGRNRNALQAALGRKAASVAETEAASLALSNSIAKVYFQWQSLNAQIDLLNAIEKARTDLILLEHRRIVAGITAGDNLHPLSADVAVPEQNLVQLTTLREQSLYQLKYLVAASGQLKLNAVPLPTPEYVLPTDLHLDLLERRPDVAAARDRVLATQSDVDAARAAFYPDFSISAFMGLNSLQLSTLLHKKSQEQGVAPALHLPIFDADRLRANLNDTRADVAYAVAQYDATVQSSIAEVNDAVLRFEGLDQEHPKILAQLQARSSFARSAQKRLDAGLTDQRELIRDRLSVLELQNQELQWQTQILAAQVDLVKALGGGYHDPSTH